MASTAGSPQTGGESTAYNDRFCSSDLHHGHAARYNEHEALQNIRILTIDVGIRGVDGGDA